MTPAEWDRQALDMALRNLKKGFDWQAYMLYCTAISRTSQPVDVVPESRADEGMSETIALFAQYAACKRGGASEADTIKALEAVVEKLRRVIVEIYHLCGSNKEREIIKELKQKLP